jgi:hypothetical protein
MTRFVDCERHRGGGGANINTHDGAEIRMSHSQDGDVKTHLHVSTAQSHRILNCLTDSIPFFRITYVFHRFLLVSLTHKFFPDLLSILLHVNSMKERFYFDDFDDAFTGLFACSRCRKRFAYVGSCLTYVCLILYGKEANRLIFRRLKDPRNKRANCTNIIG